LPTVPLFDFSNVTKSTLAFQNCTSFSSVPDFNLSAAKDIRWMFAGCSNLKRVPSIKLSAMATSAAENRGMEGAFENCSQVTGGALALYNYATGMGINWSVGYYCFANCGIDTPEGKAELQQIPNDWGGLLNDNN
jgi:hypothetical protein